MRETKKNRFITAALFLFIPFFLIIFLVAEAAIDPPHYDPGPDNPMSCPDCHYEQAIDIPSLCLSCHVSGGRADRKPVAESDQAELGIRGTFHRFDSEGLKYVMIGALNNSTGTVKITPDISAYKGDFDAENEMEYDFKIVNSGNVGSATFDYRCRTRSKIEVDSTGPWDPDVGWSSWTDTYITGSAVLLDDARCGGDRGIYLTFEDGAGSPSFYANTTGRVYVKLLNRPGDPAMEARVMLKDGIRKINCSVCHNQHTHDMDRPFLRADNVGNALCKHCHDDRDKNHYALENGIITPVAPGTPAGGYYYMVDSTKNWTDDEWAGKMVYFQKNFGGIQTPEQTEDTGDPNNPYKGFYRTITSNTSNTLYWSEALGEEVSEEIGYKITDPANIGSHPVGVVYAERDLETRFFADRQGLALDENTTPNNPIDDTVQCMTCHSPHYAHTVATEGGTATGGDTTSLADTRQNWGSGALVGQEVRIWNEFVPSAPETGTAEGGTATTLQDTDKNWAANVLIGRTIKLTPIDEERTIQSNDSNTVAWYTAFSRDVAPGDGYEIRPGFVEQGVATGGSSTTLQDTDKAWSTDGFAGYEVWLFDSDGTPKGQEDIETNDATSITWGDGPGNPAVVSGDGYEIVQLNVNWRRKRIITSNTDITIDWSAALDADIRDGDLYEIVDISTPGGGYLMDKANDETVCMTCHRYKSHFGSETLGRDTTCRDCHTPHNTTNRFLIKEVVNNRKVSLKPGDNYVNSDLTGICQVCHSGTLHWRNDGSEPQMHYANGCPQCHSHSDGENAWKFKCDRCHGYPPVPAGTKVDSEGNIVGSDNKIAQKDGYGKYTGNRLDPVGTVTEYTTPNEAIPNTSYRVEDWSSNPTDPDNGYSGGGAHLVHVIGKGITCDKCHGHLGSGPEHGGNLGRITPKRYFITFDFQLDFVFNTVLPEEQRTQIGYHDIFTSNMPGPVYPVFFQEPNSSTVGTSQIYMNDGINDFGPSGFGPGPIDIGEIWDGGDSDTYQAADPDAANYYLDAPHPDDPAKCQVGCHNPRRLWQQDEPHEDMIDNTFNWAWYFPLVDKDKTDPDYYNNLPRDEIPDVPCAMCHDAQGRIIQGVEGEVLTTTGVRFGDTLTCAADCHDAGGGDLTGGITYKGLRYDSSHPVDHSVRKDCVKCHDYWNSTTDPKSGQMLDGYIWLNEQDGGPSILFDPDDTHTLEPFCISCHDVNGRAGDRTPYSDDTSVVPDIKTYWRDSAHYKADTAEAGASYPAKVSCFGDGTTDGCHGNPHGSARRALMAAYNDSPSGEETFCYNCHGTDTERAVLAPNIKDQIDKRLTGGSSHPIPEPGDTLIHTRTEPIIPDNTHVECMDCHDPMSDKTEHRLAGQIYLDSSGNPWDPGKDRVTGDHPMAGNIRINDDGTITEFDPPDYAPPYDPNETYYVRQPYVYEVCLRCHGPNYATYFQGNRPFPDVAQDRTISTGTQKHFSDKRKEFDPRSNHYASYPNGNFGVNTSFHPVAAPGRNGTLALCRQLKTAFNLNCSDPAAVLGNLTINCTDCHNSDATGAMRGPATYSNLRDTDKPPLTVSAHNNYNNDDNQDDNRIGPHGSDNIRILRTSYDTNVYTSKQGWNETRYALCFLCHEKDVLIETNGGAPGTNFGGAGNGWWSANLHAEHLSAPTYSGSSGGGSVCHECHHNVHSNVEAQNTIYGDGMGGMMPPDEADGVIDGVSSTHLLNFGPQATGGSSFKPRWYYDSQGNYRCNMYCHGANMQYCAYTHGGSGTMSHWCEND